jgi:hypothetical protein
MTDPLLDVPGGTTLAVPTSVRTLVARSASTSDLTAAMATHLPSGGMAARRMGKRFSLAAATWRLLDSRVLTAAVEILDVDVAAPLVSWVSRAERVLAAARTTVADPRKPEMVEVVVPSRPFTHSEGLTVTVRVEDVVTATLRFRLDVSAKLGETSVVVRGGAVHEVVCDVLVVTAAVSLVGWPTPLWKPDAVRLPQVHVPVRPPMVVPLIPRPRVPEPAG